MVRNAVSVPPQYLLPCPFQNITCISTVSLLCTRCIPVLPHISILPSIAFEFTLFKTCQEIWSFLDKGPTSCTADVEKWRLLKPCDIQQGCSDTGNCRPVIYFPYFLFGFFSLFFFFLQLKPFFRGILFCKKISLMSCIAQLGKFLLYSCDKIIYKIFNKYYSFHRLWLQPPHNG